MKYFLKALIILSGICFSTTKVSAQSNPLRQKINIDLNWRFHLGDIPDAREPAYSDGDWRRLDLPHDWSIEGNYSKDNSSGTEGGFLPAGTGWYRKHLQWDSSWKNKRIILLFDGVYMKSNVWINGRHLGRHPYGYTGFYYDISPFLKKGDNVISVRVDNSLVPSARWYTGSGIYRNVWLIVTNPVHIPVWGTYVTTPEVSKSRATVQIKTSVKNERNKPVQVTLETRIRNTNGKVVATDVKTKRIDGDRLQVFKQSLTVQHPELWSPADPAIYTVESIVKNNGKTVDTYLTTTGIRNFSFTADSGFILNGKPIEFQGVAMHSGTAAIGTAVSEDLLYYRLKLLKKMGANAIRTAHNPQSPEFYTICDTLGLMVMDEIFDGWRREKAPFDYGLYFEKWWKQDVTSFIRRDRNHPSVILWSIGNEVWGYKHEQQKALADLFHQLDPTRPVTQGKAHDTVNIDIPGFNGEGELKGALQAYHQKHPNTPVIGTEMTHAYGTRGVYHTQTWYRTRDFPGPWEQKNHLRRWKRMEDKVYKMPDLTAKEVFTDSNTFYQSSYGNAFARMSAREQIHIAKTLPYLVGTFRWSAFDYLGESYGWPARAHNSGIMDLAGFPKDDYYLYQSQWSDKPMVHLFPHWTHPGKEGIKIPVMVYTNQQSAELFFNGHSLGKKEMGDKMALVWNVPYEAGKLKIVARSNGKAVIADSVQTALQPAAIEIIPGKRKVSAKDRNIIRLEAVVVDKNGTMVPDANNKITVDVKGPAKVAGVENGDILDLSPNKANWRKAFMGKCLFLIRTTQKAGEITITAYSDGLKSDTIHIQSL